MREFSAPRTQVDRAIRDAGPDHWLVGGGEMGDLIRSMDWSVTPLGPLEDWPHSLRTTVSLCLSSNFPINIVWGPSYNQIYNDGYRVIVGERHPEGMGMAYNECWASAWPAIGGPFERAWAGETSFLENQRMYLTRGGYLEETFFTFSLSPIRDQNGQIAGLFHPVTETTTSMLSERRTRSFRELAENTSEARSLESAFALAAKTFSTHELDLPFVLLYSLNEDATEAQLIESAGVEPGLHISPILLQREGWSEGWPLNEIVISGSMIEIDNLHRRFGDFACGPYPEGAERALARVLSLPGVPVPLGIIVVGVSPRLPFNQAYRDYIDQLTTAASASLANALAYEQERKRAEALAEIDRAKTQFFANVSHEFRTPLALMLGPLETVLSTNDADLSSENREQVRIARRNSLRLLKLVNTLLDFSRIEAGRTQASFEATDLATFTSELASNFRSAIESVGVEFEVDCPPLGEDVYIDRDMWEKIVLNLLSNALKFTLQGRIGVHLAIVGDSVELLVSDSGSGIPANQVMHVFERFHRVERARGRTHEGSGIGLALVNEFSRLHHGTASVESELGVGSTFRVRIPRGAGHIPAERVVPARQRPSTATAPEAYTEEASRWIPSQPKSYTHDTRDRARTAEAAPSTGHRRFRILLAEDNSDMRDYIMRVIGPEHDVESVCNGEEALAAVSACMPDMVLSDVMMPGMDGFSLVQALRAKPESRALPIILLSARAGEEAKAEGIEIGADDYLVKPFSPRELKARVRTHLELQALRNEIAAKHELLRTAEMLRQSEKLAVVGRLASSIAHEINNPLEAVTNLLYLAEGLTSDDELRRYVVQAQGELARVSNITTQTLRFHRQSTKPQQTCLSELLDEVLQLFAARTANAGIVIERQYRCLRQILAFGADLRQVFANLIGNALDASALKTTITVRVRDSSDRSTGALGIRVTIADQGHGMSDEVRGRIFEPFFTTKELTGTGLGLWVSSEILRNHHATIRVRSDYSAEKHGTVFSIFFPLDATLHRIPDLQLGQSQVGL